MALVVPFTPAATAGGAPMLQAPDTPFALMAAAQMHSEGRLIDPSTSPKAQVPDGKNPRPKRA